MARVFARVFSLDLQIVWDNGAPRPGAILNSRRPTTAARPLGCCGAVGAQMFKEEEAGTTRVNFERAEQAIETGASIVAVNCPFCTTMLTDGVKNKEKEDTVKVMDIAEMVALSLAE